MGIEIEVQGTRADWGGGDPADIRAVCESAAACFEQAVTEKPLEAIRIEPGDLGHPRTVYERTPAGQIRVRLSARERYWAKFVYQFAHEFVHVLANLPRAEPASRAGGWIDESLADAGSLYALRRMAREWTARAPYDHWRAYAPAFGAYAAAHLAEPAHQRPAGESFAAWLAPRLPALEADLSRRAEQTIVARQLLPVFEGDPAAWRAVRALNLFEPAPFPAVLDAWRAAVPVRDRAVVDRIASALAVRTPRPAALYTKSEYQAALARLARRPAELTDHDEAVLATVDPKLAQKGREARAKASTGRLAS